MKPYYPRPNKKWKQGEIPSLYPQRDERVKIYPRDLKVIAITCFFYTVLIILLTSL